MEHREATAARRALTVVVIVVLITCALMFVGLPGLLDPLPAPPIQFFSSGLF